LRASPEFKTYSELIVAMIAVHMYSDRHNALTSSRNCACDTRHGSQTAWVVSIVPWLRRLQTPWVVGKFWRGTGRGRQ